MGKARGGGQGGRSPADDRVAALVRQYEATPPRYRYNSQAFSWRWGVVIRRIRKAHQAEGGDWAARLAEGMRQVINGGGPDGWKPLVGLSYREGR